MDIVRLDRIARFAATFHDDFRRRDQARWLAVYIQGLLTPGIAKNAETMARHVVLPEGLVVADLAQALQNFISQSPWDEDAIWRRLRRRVAGITRHGTIVVEDLTFAKQGRHSVGVQRQYSSEVDRKLNCQVAVALHLVDERQYFPLGGRLYLPRRWTDDTARLASADVPPPRRSFASKVAIALDLLEDLKANDGPNGVVVAGEAYGASAEFRRGLEDRGRAYLLAVPGECSPLSGRPFESVDGEGRVVSAGTLADLAARLDESTWSGPARSTAWLRVRSVRSADHDEYGIWIERLGRADPRYSFVLAHLPRNVALDVVERHWNARFRVPEEVQHLRNHLGLDDFEGRSWRGFHHHLCLVALAHAFNSLESHVTEPTDDDGSLESNSIEQTDGFCRGNF